MGSQGEESAYRNMQRRESSPTAMARMGLLFLFHTGCNEEPRKYSRLAVKNNHEQSTCANKEFHPKGIVRLITSFSESKYGCQDYQL